MPFRTTILFLHRWLSLVLGVLFVLVSLSGSLIVLGPEIDRLVHPELFRVSAGEPVGFAVVLRAVEQAYPDRKVSVLAAPGTGLGHGTYLAQLGGEPALDVRVDPGRGEVLGACNPHHTLIGLLTDLHIYLLAGTPGERVLGTAGLVLLVVVLTGMVLWWPGIGRLGRGFRVRLGRGWYLFTYDLHGVAGAVSAPLLALIVASGAVLALGIADRVVYALFFTSPPPRPESSRPPAAAGEGRPASLDTWQRRAEQAVPDARVTMITLPKRPTDPAIVRLQAAGSPHPNGCCRVAVDPASGAVLAVQDERTFRAADSLCFRWLYPLHIGYYAGMPSRILHLLVGLAPTLLFATGILIWWKRR